MKDDRDIINAHRFSSNNMQELKYDRVCGCFYCLKIFSPEQIERWLAVEKTALCPYCGVDSVIGGSSGYPITDEFLAAMKARWFGAELADKHGKDGTAQLQTEEKEVQTDQ